MIAQRLKPMIELVRNRILIWLLLLLPFSTAAQLDSLSSNIPIIVIETDMLEIVNEYRITADMGIINNEEGLINTISDPFNDYSGKISIEYRGSTSQSYFKKSYGLETQDENGENKNVSLLNLPEENDWILSGPYSDKSLMRNILSYRLSRELGHYAPRTKLCELVLNDEYMGVYVLIEKIKRDKNRVDIAKLRSKEISGDDLTGGYILKIDKQTGNSGPLWYSESGEISFQYEYPKYDEIVPEQQKYIKSYIDDFENALLSDYFADPDLGYRQYINVRSFVDFFIINEVSKNVDGYILSTFMYKDKDSKGGKLVMGPVWDFNFSFGNANYRNAFKTDGFQVHNNPSIWWWDRLFQDSTFIDDIRNRWYSIRENEFKSESIDAIIDSLSLLLDEPQQRNFEKWEIIGHDIWPNYYVGESYGNEVSFLKTWTSNRLQWLDKKLISWNSIERFTLNPETKVYPNPFSNSFKYTFSLNNPGDISVTLYNINGIQVSKIVEDMYYPAGTVTIDYKSSEIPGSVYVLVLRINGELVSIEKLVKL
jgi:hypothetical protein